MAARDTTRIRNIPHFEGAMLGSERLFGRKERGERKDAFYARPTDGKKEGEPDDRMLLQQ
jgi:hypothetical protein